MLKCIRHICAVAAVLVLQTSLSACVAKTAEYDVALLGGRVIDPETGLDAVRNVGIKGNKISVVTSEAINAKQNIDVTGLIVSPGFIDMHAHGQSILSGRVQAFDGVTTALELESGSYPVAEYYAVREREGRPINYGSSVNWLSVRIATMLNVEPSSDAGWFSKMLQRTGWQQSIASTGQLNAMLEKVNTGLDEGGLGVGFLTGYAPGSGKKEYYKISELAAGRNVPTYTHARYLSMLEPASSFEAIQEIISVALTTGVHAHIVHLNSISLRDIDIIAPMIQAAQQQGVRLSTEAYPYGAGATSIGAAMFRGPNWQQRVGGISARNFAAGGERLTEQTFAQLQADKPETDIVVHFLELSDKKDKQVIDRALLMPSGVIASDGGDWLSHGRSIDQKIWPLPASAWSHPRSAGTFTRFIREYAVTEKKLPLIDAIAKVSFKPAYLLQQSVPQMKHKGRVQAGSDADIVVFSLDDIGDQATYEQPSKLSKGVKFLLVNGDVLIRDEKLDTSRLPGRPVRNNYK